MKAAGREMKEDEDDDAVGSESEQQQRMGLLGN